MSGVNQVYIAVIGVGGVGTHFLSQLSALTQKYPNISLILISRSSKTLTGSPQHPLSLKTWSADLHASTTPALSISDTLTFLSRTNGKCILVDNTSDQSIANAYPDFLSRGISIVTPNKKAFSSSLDLWRKIQEASYRPHALYSNQGFVFHESSVGAGLPILSTLKDLVETGDKVRRIEGVFSGTLSFLFNTFAPVGGVGEGRRWSEVVKEARGKGFTEPDPRDDLNGVDVARKLVILARMVGVDVVGVEGVGVESLVPRELEGVEGVEAFMEGLEAFDGGMEEVKMEAEREGMVVRFVGGIDVEGGLVKVGLERFERGHPIAALKGSDNIVSFYTERYGSRPLVVQGAGAGGAVTAMGVTADLIKVIQRIS